MLGKIIKASDPIAVQNSIITIYGSPGSGKTSLGGTAKRALLLDFDWGAHRTPFRPDTYQIESWQMAAGISADDVEGYSTLVVDTVGRAVDFIISGMPNTEGKAQLKTASGNPTQLGWGRVKGEFFAWLRRLRTFGVDLIFIAHDKEEKDGDVRNLRLDIVGSSCSEIIKISDFVGYLTKAEGSKSVLDFSPTATTLGKNSAGLEPIEVPDFAIQPHFFEELLVRMKTALGAPAKAHREALDKLEAFKAQVLECGDAEAFTALIPEAEKLGKPMNRQAWAFLKAEAESAGFDYDKKAKAFMDGDDAGAGAGDAEAEAA